MTDQYRGTVAERIAYCADTVENVDRIGYDTVNIDWLLPQLRQWAEELEPTETVSKEQLQFDELSD